MSARAVGKTYTMIGLDDSAEELGVIPSAVSWLYQLIDEQKQRTGARFSVRVSAVELTGRHEALRDLLSPSHQSPGLLASRATIVCCCGLLFRSQCTVDMGGERVVLGD